MDLGIALEGFFFQKVNGSTGQQVNGSTGHFSDTILYMIADDTTLSSLRPHHCKEHMASFACSTGKFPSLAKGAYFTESLTYFTNTLCKPGLFH